MKSHDRSMVGIDSMILIHAYREQFATDDLKEWNVRAKSLLDKLFKLEILVCISTITVGEFLAGIPEAEHTSMVNHFNETFTVAPYNLRAAMIAARLVPVAKLLVSGDRPVLFADTKIIGSLIAQGCKRVETFDNKFSKIATPHFRKVNQMQEQPNLPGIE